MFNKSVQSNKTTLSGQLHRIVVNKQIHREDQNQIKRKNSHRLPFKEQMNMQKTSNHFNLRNSSDTLEQVFKVSTNKRIKSPVVVVPQRKVYISTRNQNYSSSQEQAKNPSSIQKPTPLEVGYRLIVNRSSRVPTQMIEQEITRDPETFTDYVERIYGKQWFY